MTKIKKRPVAKFSYSRCHLVKEYDHGKASRRGQRASPPHEHTTVIPWYKCATRTALTEY